MFGVTAKSEGLAVPVFLVTRSARGCASGASWVFRIALEGQTVRIGGRVGVQEIAGGVDRRDLPRRAHGRKKLRLMPEYSPLSSCFYSGRTPRASDEDDVVRQEWTVRRFRPSYVFSLAEEGAEVEPVMVVVYRCEAAVDPFAG